MAPLQQKDSSLRGANPVRPNGPLMDRNWPLFQIVAITPSSVFTQTTQLRLSISRHPARATQLPVGHPTENASSSFVDPVTVERPNQFSNSAHRLTHFGPPTRQLVRAVYFGKAHSRCAARLHQRTEV